MASTEMGNKTLSSEEEASPPDGDDPAANRNHKTMVKNTLWGEYLRQRKPAEVATAPDDRAARGRRAHRQEKKKLRTTCKKTAGQRLAENARCMEMRQPSNLPTPSPSKREETARASCDKS